jgi:hypothetical protein
MPKNKYEPRKIPCVLYAFFAVKNRWGSLRSTTTYAMTSRIFCKARASI